MMRILYMSLKLVNDKNITICSLYDEGKENKFTNHKENHPLNELYSLIDVSIFGQDYLKQSQTP